MSNELADIPLSTKAVNKNLLLLGLSKRTAITCGKFFICEDRNRVRVKDPNKGERLRI